eukprot:352048-Chlamydomonas_euryale.AAC.4
MPGDKESLRGSGMRQFMPFLPLGELFSLPLGFCLLPWGDSPPSLCASACHPGGTPLPPSWLLLAPLGELFSLPLGFCLLSWGNSFPSLLASAYSPGGTLLPPSWLLLAPTCSDSLPACMRHCCYLGRRASSKCRSSLGAGCSSSCRARPARAAPTKAMARSDPRSRATACSDQRLRAQLEGSKMRSRLMTGHGGVRVAKCLQVRPARLSTPSCGYARPDCCTSPCPTLFVCRAVRRARLLGHATIPCNNSLMVVRFHVHC